MGVVAAGAIWLGATLGTVLASVAGAVSTISVAIGTAIAAASVAAYAYVVGTITGVLVGIGAVSEATALYTFGSIGLSNVTAVGTMLAVSSYTASVVSCFTAFLEIIHFKTLLAIHSIATVVSPKYRAITFKLFASISEYSHSLNVGAAFVPLLLENARNVVMDASSMMGHDYDLSQVRWYRSLKIWAKQAQKMGYQYKDNPALIMYDVDRLLLKPSIDLKSAIVRNMILGVDNALKITERVVEEFSQLEFDVKKLVNDLPESIRKEVQPLIASVTYKLDSFIDMNYRPFMAHVTKFTSAAMNGMSDNENKLTAIKDRLKKPVDYLLELDDLSYYEKQDQEKKLCNLSTRLFDRESESIRKDVEHEYKQLALIAKTLKIPLQPVAWDVPEILAPNKEDIGEIEPHLTWFVGDF